MTDTRGMHTYHRVPPPIAECYGRCCCQWGIAAILLLGFIQHGYSSQSTTREVVIGVLSNHDQDKSLEQWSATAEYLTSQISGCRFTILPFGSNDIDSVFGEPKIDFVISCPSQYIALEVLHGAVRITTMKTQYTTGSYDIFSGILFWNATNSHIRNQSIEDFRGKKLMGGHGRSCTIWQAVTRELMRYGFDTDEDLGAVAFSETNEDVINAVRDGTVDLGIIRSNVYDKMVSEGYIDPNEFAAFHIEEPDHANLPFVHSTRAYPERVMAKLKHVEDTLAERVMVSLLTLSDQSEAARSAECGGWTVPHNYQNLRECLKELKASPYERYGVITIAGVFAQYRWWIISIFALGAIILGGLGCISNLHKRLILARKVILEREVVGISDRTQKLIGQTLHDTIGQNLTGIRFLAESVIEKDRNGGATHSDSIELLSNLASQTITQTRALSRELYPVELSRDGVRVAVEEHLRNISKTFDIEYRMDWPPNIYVNGPMASLHLYRIVQESVHNSIKHGKARHILVRLTDDGDSLTLSICDDGIGFSPGITDRNGMGLHLMKYRARTMHGVLVVRNRSEGEGVVVECSIPKDINQVDDVYTEPSKLEIMP